MSSKGIVSQRSRRDLSDYNKSNTSVNFNKINTSGQMINNNLSPVRMRPLRPVNSLVNTEDALQKNQYDIIQEEIPKEDPLIEVAKREMSKKSQDTPPKTNDE